MLTPYDEFPVHQAPHPFSHIPSPDYSWDDGYWFGVFNPDEKVFLGTGFRVTPNTDMIGGYAFINIAGYQHTVRFSRCWRRDFSLSIAPFSMQVIEPLRTIGLKLAPNDSGFSFDLIWEGTAPPVLEDHHIAQNRGRLTTDQSRYSQAGMASGIINVNGRSFTVSPEHWSGARDHSWGLYAERPPLAPARACPLEFRTARPAPCASGRVSEPSHGAASIIFMRRPKECSARWTMSSARRSAAHYRQAGMEKPSSFQLGGMSWSSWKARACYAAQ